MDLLKQTATDIKDSVMNGSATKSGEEPPSGIQGKGTVDEPYDQGNTTEAAAGPGIEPPSGVTGAGTLDKPYDQGNAPESTTAATTSSKPSEPTAAVSETQATKSSQPESQTPTTTTTMPDSTTDSAAAATPAHEDRGRLTAPSSGMGGSIERDVSPGQLDDGTHVKTSGDRGESYTPGKLSLGRLKGKLHIGGKN